MSYCRICDDSDVYVLCTGTKYEVHLIGGVFSRVVDTPKEMLTVLDSLNKLGYKVPERTIKRLESELN